MKKAPYKAPTFSLKDEFGKTHSLSDFKGKWLVLYFYPKDNTPGCTIQARDFTIDSKKYEKLNATVIGISKDDAQSHKQFRSDHKLSLLLLSDQDGKTIDKYGAWGKKQFGREGILRKTFIIDPKGTVQKVYGRVIPLGHSAKVLEDLKSLQEA